ncbi:type II toxin-antitoxin system PemK/MazF family toxin [Rheinheimera muenzenbergensis]|uniref:Type II toxin-antitoxin system PemK/MazF family toxin n=1 Tax=Rheinheimera muenzenbergensis TaxID=1193628 RepID=A0ABU8C673_9GAMM
MVTLPQRFDIWLVDLNPTRGSEINKTRPCVVVSPNELENLATVLMAPMTTKGFAFPSRVVVTFQGQQGLILLDQIRAVDKQRLLKKLGSLDQHTSIALCQTLTEMFSL